jgi:hypothetical protein
MTEAFAWIATASAVASVAYVLVGTLGRRNTLRDTVFANLDKWHANGYLWPAIHAHTAPELAYRLACNAPLCGGYEPNELEPYVREWIMRRQLCL